MSFLQRYQRHFFSDADNCQHIVMDEQGHIEESDDKLFSTQSLLHAPVTAWNHFVESIFPSLLQLAPESPEVHFYKVEPDHLALMPGYYDFSFRCLHQEGAKKYILWKILDLTSDYVSLKHNQQNSHDTEISRQLKELTQR